MHVAARIVRPSRSLVAIIAASIVAAAVATPSAWAQTCSCSQTRPFGSCRDASSLALETYLGSFPGPATIIQRPGGTPFVLVADLFSGQTRISDGANVLIGESLVFPSPRGADATTGVAYHAAEERLYWTIGGKIIVTEAPLLRVAPTGVVENIDASGNTIPPAFEDVLVGEGASAQPLELTIDVAALATAIGAPAGSPRLAGLTLHTGRNKLWLVDIVNDVFFEIGLDGALSLAGGALVHFRNPSVTDLSPKAFGNALTYAETASGQFFDILTGSLSDGRPTKVVRLAAPTAPDGTEIGDPSGIEYPLFSSGLVPESTAGAAMPTSLTYWPDSCAANNSSHLLSIYDSVGTAHKIYNVSADPPAVSNISSFGCAPEGSTAIRLTWGATRNYDTLDIFRSRGSEEETLIFSTTGDTDPGTHLDTALPLPVDGAHTYRAVAKRGANTALDATCTTTLGRGQLISSAGLAEATGRPANQLVAGGLTGLAGDLFIIDSISGNGYRLDGETLAKEAEIRSPIAALGGTTSGVTWSEADDRLHWVGSVGERSVIMTTGSDGSGVSVQRSIQYPLEFVRSPQIGDIAFDAQHSRIWVSAPSHGKLFAIDPNGRLVAGSVISNPIAAGILGGGVSVRASDENSVTLDIVTGEDRPDRVIRNQYPIADLAQPTTLQTIFAGGATQSGVLGGVEGISRGGKRVVALIGSDTDRIFFFSDEDAELGSLPFRRSDVNNDGRINISDPSNLLGMLFLGGARPPCENAADANDDGALNVSDALFVFDFLFRRGVVPPAPGVECGFDSTPAELGCEASICFGG
jgi:hypothetical protein